jgi:hypothetical protein
MCANLFQQELSHFLLDSCMALVASLRMLLCLSDKNIKALESQPTLGLHIRQKSIVRQIHCIRLILK